MNDLHAIANAGTLDPSFGNNGRVLLSPEPVAALPLPEGKLLVVTTKPESYQLATIRLNVDGTIDQEFGDKGVVELPLYHNLLPRIIPAMNGGWLIHYPISRGRVLCRQLQDGTLDESFGEGGIRVVMYDSPQDLSAPIPTASVYIARNKLTEEGTHIAGSDGGVAIDRSTGKISFNGRGLDWPNPSAPAVWRLNPDGSVDTSFNGIGYVPIKPVGFEYEGNALQDSTLLENGKILVLAGYDERGNPGASNLYLVRYNQDGSVDRDFNDGRALILMSFIYWVFNFKITVRDTDGRIVIVCADYTNVLHAGLVLVLNASGSFNQVFNNGKPLLTHLSNDEHTVWRHCEIQEDGAIVVIGELKGVAAPYYRRVPIARFLPDGTLDPAFNGKGWNVYKDEPENPDYNDSGTMVITQDGRIVVSGYSAADGGWVLRYLA
ncbi:hypothetical protein [Pseudomonas grandcourensis]|uniref:hypothetical protein n=1 Tax=Pseudomonas grandcourensis TaxID=3136736 RepID=UPI003265609D